MDSSSTHLWVLNIAEMQLDVKQVGINTMSSLKTKCYEQDSSFVTFYMESRACYTV
jgi:hypothetical protein